MAYPRNPLDVYVTYTYHFELHAASSWEKLQFLEDSDANDVTTRFEPNGTLLINTRKDAHQVIDDVKYMAIANNASNSGLCTAFGEVSMIITEPGGFAFAEKIELLKEQQEITLPQNLLFVLKIMFVGRDPDNGITTEYSKLIPMVLTGMHAQFDHRGGVYNMKFQISTNLAASNGQAEGPQLRYAYTDKNVSFEATTVSDAISKLESKLNGNYEETYRNKLDRNGARKIKYTVSLDKELCGDVNCTIKNSFAPDDCNKFSFDPKKEIGAFIMDIIHRSKAVNEKIGASKGCYTKEFHPNAFMPVIVPRVHMKDDEVEVVYEVKVYKGGASDKFEFDYFFSDPGKNVDVMQYEVVFENMMAYITAASNTGHDKYVNSSATVPSEAPITYQKDIVHQDITRERIYSLAPERISIGNVKKNDVGPLCSKNVNDRNGHNIAPVGDVKSIRLAFDAAKEFVAAGANPQQTFVIRGHLDLLNICCAYPDGTRHMYGTTNGVWIKVNIWMPIGDTGEKRQFFYKGWYQLLSITNNFSGGKFTQQLTMMAVEQQPS